MANSAKGYNLPLILAALVAAIALIFAGYTWWSNSGSSSEYRAVTLTSGQVYFGKLTSQGQHYLRLEHVFYLTDPSVLAGSTAATDISLVKLGREVHAPTDHLLISRTQVLTLETLSASSQVLKAIQGYTPR